MNLLTEALADRKNLAEIAVNEIPDVLGQIESARAILSARMLTPQGPVIEPQGNDTLITVEEMAKRTTLTEQYCYDLIRKGGIPAVHIGKYIRIRVSDLSAWIEKHTEKPLDKQLYQRYNNSYERKGIGKDPKGARSYSSANGRQDRDNVKRFGATGTGRAENLGAHIPTGQTSGSD